jgi:hypothetical protein
MSETTSVDTDQMTKVMPQVDELENRLAAANNGLVADATPLENAAGDDAAGKAFYDAYSTARDQITGATRDLQTITASIRDGINTMVRGYTQTEEDNTIATPNSNS